MSAEVPFVRVVPAEIERYGFAGATFVAHIRYRCATDGPGRFVADGVRWWRVPLAELAAELHVSKDVAQRTIKRLGNAVTAKHFGDPEDRTRAYHVPPDVTTQNAESHRPELPERDSAPATQGRRGIAPTPTRNRTDPDAKSRHVPLSGEGEEGGEGGRADAPQAAAITSANSEPAPPDPFDYGDDPPGVQPDPFGDAAPATAAPPTWVRGPYGPRCRRHANIEVPPNCPGCGAARKAAKTEDDEAEERAAAARAAAHKARVRAVADCQRCDDMGWLLGLDGRVTDDAVRCTHQPAEPARTR